MEKEAKYQIVLFYKYVFIENPELLKKQQVHLCQKLGLTGRIIIAQEGINATVEGTEETIALYCKELLDDPRFFDTHLKKSTGTGHSFPKLSIKVRNEIVSGHLGEKDVNPNKVTGKYITADELHEWFENKKEFYIVDMRNDYEHAVGHFRNSILPKLTNFRDLPTILPEIEHLKGKTVVTTCTGGIRCEKASGFLVANGFSDVYQLYGGMVTYMEKYPNGHFLGKLYVFDGRVTMAFNETDPDRVVVGRCDKCKKPAEEYVNCGLDECHRHFICCQDCRSDNDKAYCDSKCEMLDLKKQMVPA
jgi:UPF0176 protein